MNRDVGVKSVQYSQVESFHLTISLPMIGNREQSLYVEDLAYVLKNLEANIHSLSAINPIGGP